MDKKTQKAIVIEKVLNLLHLCRKAGKLETGFDACQRSCSQGRSNLLLMAEDLSSRQKSNLRNIADANNVKLVEFGSKEILGNSLKLRDVGIISVEDKNFARGIVLKLL